MDERPLSGAAHIPLNVRLWVFTLLVPSRGCAGDRFRRLADNGLTWETYPTRCVDRFMAKRWVTGWKLEPRDRDQLLVRFEPLFPDVIADHVTLRTGVDHKTPLPRETLGEIVGEIDDSAGVQALVVRIGGSTDRSDGSTYHITWSIDRARGRRPVESNDVIAQLGWRSLPEAVPIRLKPARF